MSVIFKCLKRSRIAKHEVIERLLFRKISDGQWCLSSLQGEDQTSGVESALKTIQLSRSRLENEHVRRCLGSEKLLSYFPELTVGYDYVEGVHFVAFEAAGKESLCVQQGQ